MSKFTRARLLLALATTAAATAAALLLWQHFRTERSSMRVTAADSDEPIWRQQDAFVVDPVAGLRPRRSSIVRIPRLVLGTTEPEQTVKHRDRHGFLREHELPDPIDRPTALVVGDSHIDGVVSTEHNVTSLLEQQTIADGEPWYVLNAACGNYSLWQSVLRARDLLPRYRPRVVVIIVFLGNDFLDLDNPTMPHLDDELREQPERELLSAETTTRRHVDLALPPTYEYLFWQGLNQALFLHRDPARLAIWMQKAGHAVDSMQKAAAAHEARVVWALLPSFDLVFPNLARTMSPLAREVVTGGAQRRARDAFRALLDERSATVVDFEPSFTAAETPALYALDFHVYRRAHELMAKDLYGPMRRSTAK